MKKRKAKARRTNPTRRRRFAPITAQKRLENPRRKRRRKSRRSKSRRRRRNPGFAMMVAPKRALSNPRRRRHHRRHRNPSGGGLVKSILNPIKEHAIPAAVATLLDSYVVNKGINQFLAGQSPTVKSAVKVAAYPLLGAIAGRFLPGKVGSIVKEAAVFGLAFGIKDLVQSFLGASSLNGLGYLSPAYSGTGYLSPPQGVGYLTNPDYQGMGDVSGFTMYSSEQG